MTKSDQTWALKMGYPWVSPNLSIYHGLSCVFPCKMNVAGGIHGNTSLSDDPQGGRAQLMSISRSSSRFAIVVRYLGHRQANVKSGA